MAEPSKGIRKGYSGLHPAYRVVIALILTSFIPLSLTVNCVGLFYAPLSESLGVNTGVLSYFTSILWLAAMVALPMLGKMMAKSSAKLCVGGACVLIAADFVWLSFTASLWQFYVGAFVMGIGVAMLMFLAPSSLVNRWFVTRRGFYVGLIMAFTGVGGVVFSSVGGMLIQSFGWQTTYMVFAVLAAIIAVVSTLLISTSPEERGIAPVGLDASGDQAAQAEALAAANAGMAAKDAYKTPAFVLLLLLAFFMNFGMYVYYVTPAYIGTLPIGIEIPLLGATAASVAMAAQTISKLSLGAIGDKRTYSSTAVSLGLGVIGVLILGFMATSQATVFVGVFAYGFYYGLYSVMMPILTRKAFGVKDYPQIYSRVSMVASIAGVASGFAWGSLMQVTGTWMSVFIGVAACLALSIFMVAFLASSSKKTAARF